MKHPLFGIAAFATASGVMLGAMPGAALAQSSVTVYGSIDAGLRNATNVNAAGDSVLTMSSNGTFRSNRLGFRGVEDLGNGLKATFVLESGFNSGTGALNNTTNALFQREAHVGLQGAFGEVELGRQYTVAYKTILAFDPFVYRYPSITYALSSTAGTRRSNDIQYTGKFGPVTLRAEYALGEVEGSTSNGTAQAIGANYAEGPLKAGVSYTKAKQNVGSAALPVYKDYEHLAAGAAYTFGAVTVSAGYVDQQQQTIVARDDTLRWTWAGLAYKLNPATTLTGAWYRTKAYTRSATASLGAGDGKKNLYMLGLQYNLSKRTVLYAEYDHHSLDGSYARGGTTRLNQNSQSGVSAGIMHMF